MQRSSQSLQDSRWAWRRVSIAAAAFTRLKPQLIQIEMGKLATFFNLGFLEGLVLTSTPRVDATAAQARRANTRPEMV